MRPPDTGRSRAQTKKQKIVLGVAAAIVALFAWRSFSEAARAIKQPFPPEALFINIMLGMVERFTSPFGIASTAILGGLFCCYPQPRDTGTEDDGFELFDHATRLERQGRVQEAIAAYCDIARRYARTAAARDAQKSIESLRAKIG